jgi:hypothetical protein
MPHLYLIPPKKAIIYAGMIATLRRYALCLALLAVTLRGLVPVGMMPDLAALADNSLKISLCAPLSADGPPQGDNGHMAKAPCWFAVNASFALLWFAATVLILAVAANFFYPLLAVTSPLRHRASPPSRAPPSFV